jgi:hypothetical protein
VEALTNPKQQYGDRKVALHLCPPSALIYMAIGLKEGADKYEPWNYRKSQVEAMTYVGAIMRHLMAFVDGEYYDEEGPNKKPHLAGAMASLAILIDVFENGTVIDNRPHSYDAAKRLLKEYQT